MKLTRVHLFGFGQFHDGLDIRFSEDQLNLVVGRNEAGKSTLMNSIVGILFGFRDLNLVRKYEPWDEHEAYAGELEIEADDGRTLRIWRDFKTNQATVQEIREDEIVPLFRGSADPRGNKDEDQTYFEHLGRLIGMKDEAIFRSTVFFGQQSLQTAVSDQIRRLISGSSSIDYKGVLHELHSRYAELTTENPWKARTRGKKRVIEETRRLLSEEKNKLHDGRRALSRGTELEHEIHDLAARTATLESEESTVREQLATHERLHALLTRRDDTERRYRESLTRRDNFHRYADRAAQVEDRLSREFARYRTAPDDLPDLVRAHAAELVEMQRDQGALVIARRELQELRPLPNNKAGFAIACVAALAGYAGLSFTAFAGPAAIVAAVVLAPIGFLIGRRLDNGFKEARANAEDRIREMESVLGGRKKKAQDLLSRAGSVVAGRDAEDIVREFKEAQALREEKKRLLAATKALGDRDAVEREFAEASRERGAIEVAFEELHTRAPSLAGVTDRALVGRRIEELRRSTTEASSDLAKKRSRLEQLRVELASLGARMDFDVPDLEEGVREKERRLARYDLELAALKEAIDQVDLSIKEFQEGDVFRLSEEISEIFAKITGEKYSRVHLGASLEPVVSRGDRIPISPSDLSQGAQDQLFFAMRIAMARHLSKDVRLPVFLDDPFVNFDAERLAITRDVLQNLDGHQVIMVTCNREYESWPSQKIDLDLLKS